MTPLHIFGLANVLKRPIILLDGEMNPLPAKNVMILLNRSNLALIYQISSLALHQATNKSSTRMKIEQVKVANMRNV